MRAMSENVKSSVSWKETLIEKMKFGMEGVIDNSAKHIVVLKSMEVKF